MALTLASPPSVEPVSLAEAKAHCRVEHDEDDTLISALIPAAREHVEAVTKRVLITQEWTWKLDAFPCQFNMPKPPLQSVESITYVDSAGNTQTLDAAEYRVDNDCEPGRITEAYDASWPTTRLVTNAVTVAFTAGYGQAGTDVPQPIRQAILLLIGHWYENRESVAVGVSVAELPQAVEALLSPYRMVYF